MGFLSVIPRISTSRALYHRGTGKRIVHTFSGNPHRSHGLLLPPVTSFNVMPSLYFISEHCFSFRRFLSVVDHEPGSNVFRLSAACSMAATHVVRRRNGLLQTGVLVEFKRNSGGIGLGVTQSREGRRSWIVLDQVNVIIPGGENFKPEDVSELLRQVELLQDQTRLEIAWEKVLSCGKLVDLEELALVLYGSTAADKCYGAYRLLTTCPFYFECKDDSFSPLYGPRTVEQVRQLRLHALGEEVAHKKFLDFLAVVKTAMGLSFDQKPNRGFWESRSEFTVYLESLKIVALETSASMEKKKSGMQVLDALGLGKNSAGAIDVMIQIGYFGVHENFDLLKLDLPTCFPEQVIEAVGIIKSQSPQDLDEDNRVDLTSLKVFSIDTENPKEIDDGISAIKLPDGRFKVWIHVADPTRWVSRDCVIRKEAHHRGTSIYLPTMTIPMFPVELGWHLMSLRQGEYHPAVSISAILSEDGSIAESFVENSMICATCNLSYEAAAELLARNEDFELSTLHEAALLRSKWRNSNGALNDYMPKPSVCVEGEETMDPKITIKLQDASSPSFVLVSEMMILCGEIIAKYGGEQGVPLPYRCQTPNVKENKDAFSIPEGPARIAALLHTTAQVDVNYLKPSQHAALGLPGYVQFTSPIRRYTDLLAHFQVKAALRGEKPPFSPDYLEGSLVSVNEACRTARKLQNNTERYWILEYLRRQPPHRAYQACVLRFVNNTTAMVIISELGLKNLMVLRSKRKPGEQLYVEVVESHPRKSYLQLREL
ncbi:hypothetical protein KP509_12G013800 [Ceratopteris richardii]|uniref:RNB domain-containing protein n=1 Tax=Ceratopteris richardii TaxID=49495 RepID=A0A8T2TGQ8_CERRI|nr:hypothetical protein KP509_12G013800 [Ceratopteris richardii]